MKDPRQENPFGVLVRVLYPRRGIFECGGVTTPTFLPVYHLAADFPRSKMSPSLTWSFPFK